MIIFKEKYELKAEIDRLTERLDESIQQRAKAKKELDDALSLVISKTREITDLKKDNKKLKKMCREQTEADLLINALKAVGIIKDQKKADYFANESALNAKLNQLQKMANNYQSCAVHDPFGTGLGQILG